MTIPELRTTISQRLIESAGKANRVADVSTSPWGASAEVVVMSSDLGVAMEKLLARKCGRTSQHAGELFFSRWTITFPKVPDPLKTDAVLACGVFGGSVNTEAPLAPP
jgi:hypothetical protein